MIPRNPENAHTGGDAFGSGPGFVLSFEQARAWHVIRQEHARTGAEVAVVGCPGPRILRATVKALARMGAVVLRESGETGLWAIPTPEDFLRRVREERQREATRAAIKARRIR